MVEGMIVLLATTATATAITDSQLLQIKRGTYNTNAQHSHFSYLHFFRCTLKGNTITSKGLPFCQVG